MIQTCCHARSVEMNHCLSHIPLMTAREISTRFSAFDALTVRLAQRSSLADPVAMGGRNGEENLNQTKLLVNGRLKNGTKGR